MTSPILGNYIILCVAFHFHICSKTEQVTKFRWCLGCKSLSDLASEIHRVPCFTWLLERVSRRGKQEVLF